MCASNPSMRQVTFKMLDVQVLSDGPCFPSTDKSPRMDEFTIPVLVDIREIKKGDELELKRSEL